jgi:hypothetical protein
MTENNPCTTLLDTINTGEQKDWNGEEKEKIDHPHELKLITNSNPSDFTCSNISMHMIRTDKKPYRIQIEDEKFDTRTIDIRTIDFNYEKAEYTGCTKYYKCTQDNCNYNLCLECYGKVYCNGKTFPECGTKKDPILFDSKTDIEAIIDKFSDLYSKFSTYKDNYIIYENEVYLWYDYESSSKFFRERGDRQDMTLYECLKCNHKYSALVPRFINKYMNDLNYLEVFNFQKRYICPYCATLLPSNSVKSVNKNFTYCGVNYEYSNVDSVTEANQNKFYYFCRMCHVYSNYRGGHYNSQRKRTPLCLNCSIKIMTLYKNPEEL